MENPIAAPASAELPKSPGIYLLKHRVTGDTYVGSAASIRTRFRQHVKTLADGTNLCSRLRRVARENGVDFDCSVLELTGDEPRFDRERFWIEEIKPTLNKNSPPAVDTRDCSDKTKDRRLVIVPENIRNMVTTLATRDGVSFEAKAGDLLAKAAQTEYAAFIRSEASKLPPKPKR